MVVLLVVETFANQMGPHVSPCDSLFTHLPPTLCRSSPAAAVACPRALLLSGILLLLLQWWVTDVQSFSQEEEEEDQGNRPLVRSCRRNNQETGWKIHDDDFLSSSQSP